MATFAAAVSANMERMVVPVPQLAAERAIAARQTDSFSSDFPTSSLDPACESATDELYTIFAAVPTPASDLENWAETATAVSDDSCDFSVPASLSSEYNDYSSSVVAWYSSYSSEIEDAISECTDLGLDVSDFSVCTANDALTTGTASGTSKVASVSATTTSSGTKTTASGTSTKSSSSSSSATSAAATAGAAAREVGIVGAVVAGVLGAVIAL